MLPSRATSPGGRGTSSSPTDFRARHQSSEIDTWGTREHGAAAPSAADEELLEELRALGYLD